MSTALNTVLFDPIQVRLVEDFQVRNSMTLKSGLHLDLGIPSECHYDINSLIKNYFIGIQFTISYM